MFGASFSVFTVNLPVISSSIFKFTLVFLSLSSSKRQFDPLSTLMVLSASFLSKFASFTHLISNSFFRKCISFSLSYPGIFFHLNKYFFPSFPRINGSISFIGVLSLQMFASISNCIQCLNSLYSLIL